MKSKDHAQRTYNNLNNHSSSKQQYSFGRDKRFKHRHIQHSKTDYYELPSQISRKGGVIGNAKRDCQKDYTKKGPAPGAYNPHQIQKEPSISFAASRQKCLAKSAFFNTTIDYPGPGNYDPKQSYPKKQCLMTSKPQISYETISPGPKYNFESTLLDRNKILSNLKKGRGTVISQPSRRASRISYTQMSQSKTSFHQTLDEGYISCSGKKSIGKAGKAASIGHEKRFRPASAKGATPGPGQYALFSEFIEIVKK